MLFRLISSPLIVLCIFVSISCKRTDSVAQRTDQVNRPDEIELGQNVTTLTQPQDVIFVDFEKNWRKFISPLPELALPVIPLRTEQQKTAWEPLVLSECVFSADAGGYVPQVTLTWNETGEVSGPFPPTQPAAMILQQQTYPPPKETPTPPKPDPDQRPEARMRIDLGVHHKAFERNRYSSALPTDINKRFNIPSNSQFVTDTDAMLLTGPSLFPKLMDFRTEILRERDTNREIPKQTLVLRDLSPGLSYTIRLSIRGANQWTEVREFVFLTPICPKRF